MIREKALILENRRVSPDTVELRLAVSFAGEVKPGQFINIYLNNSARLLPRPLSICRADADAGTVRIIYRTAGEGTKELSGYGVNETVFVMGPLGHGFPVEEYKGKRVILAGGGIGLPPLIMCAEALAAFGSSVISVCGYRTAGEGLLLFDEFSAYGKCHASTDDGSFGTNGTVIDCMKENSLEADVIFACGPIPMLKAVKKYAASKDIECFISMEERMACGIGACLACVCNTTEKDAHFNVNKKRVCKDGPVFNAREVDI